MFPLLRNVWMKALSVLLISFEQNVINEWSWYKNVCLAAPNWILQNITNVDLTWPVTPNWAEVKFWRCHFWAILGISRLVLTRETRRREIRNRCYIVSKISNLMLMVGKYCKINVKTRLIYFDIASSSEYQGFPSYSDDTSFGLPELCTSPTCSSCDTTRSPTGPNSSPTPDSWLRFASLLPTLLPASPLPLLLYSMQSSNAPE